MKNIPPVVVLLGEETLLKETAIKDIKGQCFNKAADPSSVSFNLSVLDGRTTLSSSIINECNQMPFMGERRLVIVKDADKILDEKLLEYINNPSPSTCLVLVINKLDKRLSAYKSIKEHAEIQEFDHPDEKILSSWIQNYVKSQKKNISAFDASTIASALENNLSGIKQELDKIITYIADRDTITNKDISILISQNKTSDSFDLTDAIQDKNTGKAIALVDKLIYQGDAFPQITGTLRWMLTRVWTGKDLIKDGDNESISKELRVHPYYLNKFITQVNKFTIADLKGGIIKLLEAEKNMRSFSLPHRLLLELLIVQLTEKTTAGAVA